MSWEVQDPVAEGGAETQATEFGDEFRGNNSVLTVFIGQCGEKVGKSVTRHQSCFICSWHVFIAHS